MNVTEIGQVQVFSESGCGLRQQEFQHMDESTASLVVRPKTDRTTDHAYGIKRCIALLVNAALEAKLMVVARRMVLGLRGSLQRISQSNQREPNRGKDEMAAEAEFPFQSVEWQVMVRGEARLH